MHARSVLALLATLVLLSVAVGTATAGTVQTTDQTLIHAAAENGTTPQTNGSSPPDPTTDVLGWENGYWYNESIAVNQTDGLNQSELEQYKARTMARVERIRGLEFKRDVEVEFVDQDGLESYVDRNVTQIRGGEQFWEALFVFGEETNASKRIYQTLHGSVGGMAAEEGVDHVVLVTENESRPRAVNFILAHELVHMLQDQHFDLSDPRYQRSTFDGELAKDGIVEGGASYVDGQYREKCSGKWDCVPAPSSIGGGAGSQGSRIVGTVMGLPYTDGAVWVRHLVETEGWQAVDDRHRDPPAAFETVIHPEGNHSELPEMTVTDRSTDGWERVETEPETAGEVGVFVTFFAQSVRGNSDVMDPGTIRGTADDPLNVSHPLSAGWGNDELYTYRNGTDEGYLWVIEWDSRADARDFSEGYRQLLSDMGADWHGDNVAVLSNGSFADAFAVHRNGTRVTIVNGPTTEALQGIRPGISSGQGAAPQNEGEPVTEAVNRTDDTASNETETTGSAGPGFGVLTVLIALVGFVAVAKRRVH